MGRGLGTDGDIRRHTVRDVYAVEIREDYELSRRGLDRRSRSKSVKSVLCTVASV
jgi:hypothetical protein